MPPLHCPGIEWVRAFAAAPDRGARALPVSRRPQLDDGDDADDRGHPCRAGQHARAGLAAVRPGVLPSGLRDLRRMRLGPRAGRHVFSFGEPAARGPAGRARAPGSGRAVGRGRAADALPEVACQPRGGAGLEARSHRRRVLRDAVLLPARGRARVLVLGRGRADRHRHRRRDAARAFRRLLLLRPGPGASLARHVQRPARDRICAPSPARLRVPRLPRRGLRFAGIQRSLPTAGEAARPRRWATARPLGAGVKMHQESLRIESRGQGLHDVTEAVRRVVRAAGVRTGLCNVCVQHTSASLVVQENADPAVRRDLETFLARLAPEDGDYEHDTEGPDDMPSHIRAAITRTAETLPVSGGDLALGTWQALYLWEHRRAPHRRTLLVTVWGA